MGGPVPSVVTFSYYWYSSLAMPVDTGTDYNNGHFKVLLFNLSFHSFPLLTSIKLMLSIYLDSFFY